MSTPHCKRPRRGDLRKPTTIWVLSILTIITASNVWASNVWLSQFVLPSMDDVLPFIIIMKAPCPSQSLSFEDVAKSMEDDWYVVEMRKTNLHRSVTQHIKFHTKKHSLLESFPKEKLYSAKADEYASLILNDEYAYLHVFKNGGSSLHIQTNRGQLHLEDPEIAKRKWLTFVRDPIDHFLSGWAECGDRSKKKSDATYDKRIQQWLEETKLETHNVMQNCAIHSFPQANFMLDANDTAYEQLELVGDLNEMTNVVEIIGFPYNHSLGAGRNASENGFKQQHYPARKDLISNETMRAICDFVAIDYYLFDFEPPEACKAFLISGNVN